MVYVGAWYGPGVVPRAIPRCNDYTTNHAYNGQCTSIHPPVNRPLPVTPYYDQLNCAQNLPEHPPGFTVCGNCQEATQDLRWYKLAKAKIVKPPPNNKPWGRRETKRWRGFLTRMCRTCELREQYLIRDREGHPGHAPATHPPAIQQAQMRDYPRVTCTCLWMLQSPRRCRQHYRLHWTALKPQLEQDRNTNAEWLRTTTLHPGTGMLWTANQAREDDRYYLRNRRMLRACRCGREVTQREPEVYQCMACEGIVQVTAMSDAYRTAHPPAGLQLVNSATPGARLALQRARSMATR